MEMTWIAGADVFKRGWFVVLADLSNARWEARQLPDITSVIALPENPKIIAVDMPIGIPDVTKPGGRECERLARTLLKGRTSSVFSVVGRKALGATTHAEAHAASLAAGGIGVAAQSWGLTTKLREVDSAMTPSLQSRVFEVHPELCFSAMNGGVPMSFSKSNGAGENERISALNQAGVPHDFVTEQLATLKSHRDDFIDACAAAWTAKRIFEARAERLPRDVTRDSRGLDMAIWY